MPGSVAMAAIQLYKAQHRVIVQEVEGEAGVVNILMDIMQSMAVAVAEVVMTRPEQLPERAEALYSLLAGVGEHVLVARQDPMAVRGAVILQEVVGQVQPHRPPAEPIELMEQVMAEEEDTKEAVMEAFQAVAVAQAGQTQTANQAAQALEER